MPKLSPIRAKDLTSILERDGRKTTIPMHAGEKVGVGLLRKILRDANISRSQFEKLR